MRFVGDFHIHSKYARAVSPKMLLPELDRWADDKGITVMSTGDFTHPLWFAQIVDQLEPAEPGLFRLKKEHQLPTIKNTKAATRFLLTVEISSIYSRAGKVHRVHTIIFAPDIATIARINEKLNSIGNIKSDGRPILGLDVRELMNIVLTINPACVVIPAHIWTPWFSIFGSKSGFNSIEACFGDWAKHIFAMETGLSSDPLMNWRLSMLDKIALISNSDSHSLERIGREANIFDTELSYQGIVQALRDNDPKSFVATIEYFPEEGMYHIDGHRKCGISYAPEETSQRRGICESCGKPVTVGVLNRLEKLADRPVITPIKTKFEEVTSNSHPGRVPFINLVTLDSILGEVLDVGVKSKAVKAQYDILIRTFGAELPLLLQAPLVEIAKATSPVVAEAISRVRERRFSIQPGFDGQYGVVKIFSATEKTGIAKGNTLF